MIIISDYNEAWPVWFEEIADCLWEELSPESSLLNVEHVGSTAVPGLPARPTLDIHVVAAGAASMDSLVRDLGRIGYAHLGDLGVPGREAFRRKGPDAPLRSPKRDWAPHNLSASAAGGRELGRHLAFRDRLRQHPEDCDAYTELRRRLAVSHATDVEAYVDGKTEFVEERLRRAGGA